MDKLFIKNVKVQFFRTELFIIDLFLLFRNSNNFKCFLKENWLDIILLIPFFRVFKIAKFRKMGKVLN